MKARTLIAAAAVALGAAALPSTGDASAEGRERATRERTHQFLRAFERRDLAAVTSMLRADATLVHPITFSGGQEPEARFVGREQVLGYFRGAFALMGRVDFRSERVSVADRGRTSFVQTLGDFTTADGRPYRNVYLFRLDWRSGRIASGEEYYNPVTFSQTFGPPLG
jgi:ketosteroid isomerase-like protein